MPASVKTTAEVYNILHGNGAVTLAAGVVAAGAATGFVTFAKRIKLWDRLSPVEQHEMELLDDDMPEGWWRRHVVQRIVPAAMHGRSPVWHPGAWDSETSDEQKASVVHTPMLDEATDTLI